MEGRRKCSLGKGTMFIVMSFMSTLSEPSKRMPLVRLSSAFAASTFILSYGFFSAPGLQSWSVFHEIDSLPTQNVLSSGLTESKAVRACVLHTVALRHKALVSSVTLSCGHCTRTPIACTYARTLAEQVPRALAAAPRARAAARRACVDHCHDVEQRPVLHRQHRARVLRKLSKREHGVVRRRDDVVVGGGEERHREAEDVGVEVLRAVCGMFQTLVQSACLR
jgi:hypothetical protein